MASIRHLCFSTCQKLPFFSAFIATALSGILLIIDLIHDSSTIESVKVIYEISVVTVGFFVIFAFSWILRFCWLQLLGILYTYVFFVCLWLTRYPEGQYGIFGQNVLLAHFIIFITGLLYSIFVIHTLLSHRKSSASDPDLP